MMDGVLMMWLFHGGDTDVEQAKLSRMRMKQILLQIKLKYKTAENINDKVNEVFLKCLQPRM